MAQKTVVTLTDDIDGSDAAETVVFGLDGAGFEIDLSAAHAEDLREVLEPYTTAGRPAPNLFGSGRRRTSSVPAPRSLAEIDIRAVRAWASANGVSVSSWGCIKAEVVEQYCAAAR